MIIILWYEIHLITKIAPAVQRTTEKGMQNRFHDRSNSYKYYSCTWEHCRFDGNDRCWFRTIWSWICHCRATRIQWFVISLGLTGTCCQLMQNIRLQSGNNRQTPADMHGKRTHNTRLHMCEYVKIESKDWANTLKRHRKKVRKRWKWTSIRVVSL